MTTALRRIPRFGMHHAIFALGRGGHPYLLIVVLVVVAFAIFMAVRNGRGGR